MTRDCCQIGNCCCYWRRICQKTHAFRTKNTRGLVMRESRNASACLSSELQKRTFHCLLIQLGLPGTFDCYQRTIADKLEGLCISLRWMLFPCRYSDKLARFGQPVPELSMISNTVMNDIYDIHGHKLYQCNHDILNPRYFDTYTDAILRKGAALQFVSDL